MSTLSFKLNLESYISNEPSIIIIKFIYLKMKQNEIQLIKTYRDEIKRTILKLENSANE